MQTSFIEECVLHAAEIVNLASATGVTMSDANTSAVVSSGGNSLWTTQLHMFQKTTDKTADDKARMAVANAVHSLGWPFSCTTHPSFKAMVAAIKESSANFKLPGRNEIAGWFHFGQKRAIDHTCCGGQEGQVQ